MTSPISTIITNFKKNDIESATISFRNNAFHQVGFLGKIYRTLLGLICIDGFKDCNPKYITMKMVEIFNANRGSLSERDRKEIYNRMRAYARRNKTTGKLSRISLPINTPLKPPLTVMSPLVHAKIQSSKGTNQALSSIKGQNIEQPHPSSRTNYQSASMSLTGPNGEQPHPSGRTNYQSASMSLTGPNGEQPPSNHQSSSMSLNGQNTTNNSASKGAIPYILSPLASPAKRSPGRPKASTKVSLDWKQIYNDCKLGKVSKQDLIDYVKIGDMSELNPNAAVRLFAMISSKPGGPDLDIHFYFNSKQQGAISQYLLRKCTQKSINIEKATWQDVITYTSIPNDVQAENTLKAILEKNTDGLSEAEALQIVQLLLIHKDEFAIEFAAKLTSLQIGLIAKYFDQHKLFFELIEESKLAELCKQKYDRELLSIYLEQFLAPIEEEMLPNDSKELWEVFFLGMELLNQDFEILAKKFLKIGADDLQDLLNQSQNNETFVKNIEKLRALALSIHQCNDSEKKVLETYIIPFLNILEPENSFKYVTHATQIGLVG